MSYKELEKINKNMRDKERARISYSNGRWYLAVKGKPLYETSTTEILATIVNEKYYITNLRILAEYKVVQ